MNQYEIASEFDKLYQDLYLYTQKALKHFSCKLTPEEILSDCYMHIYENREIITPQLPLEAIAKNWIKKSIVWSDSPIKRTLLVKEKFPEAYEATTEWHETDLEQHILDWELTLTPIEKRLWSIYYKQDMQKGKQIAEYLGISISSAYNTLRECRKLAERLKTHIKKTL